MKRETLRNGLILSVLGMTFCLSTAIMVTSCQKQSFDDRSHRKVRKAARRKSCRTWIFRTIIPKNLIYRTKIWKF